MTILDTDIDWELAPVEDAPADPDPLVAALIDMLAYRTLLQALLDQVHELTFQLEREQEMRYRLLDEYRGTRR